MEINLTLDEAGRTALNSPPSDSSEPIPALNYSTRTFRPSTTARFLEKAAIIADAVTLDSASHPRTMFLSATECCALESGADRPRCLFEDLAMQVFKFHTSTLPTWAYDSDRSGAEWWVQVRPSGPTSHRFKQPPPASASNNESVNEKTEGVSELVIPWHWDKDEALRDLAGGLFVHPHISTVTYLQPCGAPTVVLEGCFADTATGAARTDCEGRTMRVTFPSQAACKQPPDRSPLSQRDATTTAPGNQEGDGDDENETDDTSSTESDRVGKHMSFDGRLLHGAVEEFLPDGAWSELTHQGAQRVTFLVNIWLNHVPLGVRRMTVEEGEAMQAGSSSSSSSSSAMPWRMFDESVEETTRMAPVLEVGATPRATTASIAATSDDIRRESDSTTGVSRAAAASEEPLRRVIGDSECQPLRYVIGEDLSLGEREVLRIEAAPLIKLKVLAGDSETSDVRVLWQGGSGAHIVREVVRDCDKKKRNKASPEHLTEQGREKRAKPEIKP